MSYPNYSSIPTHKETTMSKETTMRNLIGCLLLGFAVVSFGPLLSAALAEDPGSGGGAPAPVTAKDDEPALTVLSGPDSPPTGQTSRYLVTYIKSRTKEDI